MADKYTNLESFIGKELPQEIIEQLKVHERIKFSLKPTIDPSAVSSIGDSISKSDITSPEKSNQEEIDRLINSVDNLEKLVEQLEDMSDELTKDMNIPPVNDLVSAASKAMGSQDKNGNITKDVFDNSLAAMDYFPALSLGYDPILSALTGDVGLDGKWLECNELTKDLGKSISVSLKTEKLPEETIDNQYDKVAKEFNDKQQNMALELILMLWWNIIWPKFIVDLSIIEPLRRMYAIPFDNLVLFFPRKCGTRWFKKKSKSCVEKFGPINKALEKFRNFLLCVIPPKAYPRYKPQFPFGKKPNCKANNDSCDPETSKEIEPNKDKGSIKQMGDIMDGIVDSPCNTSKEFLESVDKKTPSKLGTSPECMKSAKIVLDAVINDALQPKSNFSGGSATNLIKDSNNFGG